jgi:hypothetical protein
MIGDNRPISIKVSGNGGISTSRNAESIGLIVTELVINSLKHAFNETTKDRLPLPTMCQEQIGSSRSPTMAPVSLMVCSLSRKPGLVPAWLKRSQTSLMLKW